MKQGMTGLVSSQLLLFPDQLPFNCQFLVQTSRNGDPQLKKPMRAANLNQPPCLAFWGPWAPPGPCCPAGLAWFPKAPEPTAVCLVYARRPSGLVGKKSEALFSVERRVDHDVWQAMASLELLFLKDYNGMSCGISWELFMRYNGISISWGFNVDIMWIHWHAMGCLRIGVPTQREMSFATNEATQGLLIWG